MRLCTGLFAALFLLVASTGIAAAPPSDVIRITTSSQEALNEFTTAQQLVTAVRTDEARTHLGKAIQLDPTFAMAHYMLAVIAPTTDDALRHNTEAIKYRTTITDGERLLIESQQASLTGNMVRCEDLARRVVEMHPEDTWARLTLAFVYAGLERHTDAIDQLERILTVDPDYPPAFNMLGYENMALGRYEAAETAFKRYTTLIPNEPNPHDSYAEFLMKVGRYDESIRTYEKALDVNKGFHTATIGIANNLILKGQQAAARLRLQTLFDHAQTSEWKRAALAGMIRSFVSEGKFERALTEAKRRRDIALKDKNAIAAAADLNTIGTLMIAARNVDPARGTYLKVKSTDTRKATQIQKTLAEAHKVLDGARVTDEAKASVRLAILFNEVDAAVTEGDLATARRKTDEYRMIAARTGNPVALRNASTLRAIVAIGEKRYTEALDSLKNGNQDDPMTLFRLMEVHEQLGQEADARDIRRKILSLNEGSLQYAMVRHWVSE